MANTPRGVRSAPAVANGSEEAIVRWLPNFVFGGTGHLRKQGG
jgi:hypothetical protein